MNPRRSKSIFPVISEIFANWSDWRYVQTDAHAELYGSKIALSRCRKRSLRSVSVSAMISNSLDIASSLPAHKNAFSDIYPVRISVSLPTRSATIEGHHEDNSSTVLEYDRQVYCGKILRSLLSYSLEVSPSPVLLWHGRPNHGVLPSGPRCVGSRGHGTLSQFHRFLFMK